MFILSNLLYQLINSQNAPNRALAPALIVQVDSNMKPLQGVKGIEEHKEIVDAIRDQDPEQAKIAMKKHFKDLYQYCYNIE